MACSALSQEPSATSVDLTFIDLFAGCGGLALGFLEAGFLPVFAVELDADAATTYALNVDSRVATADIVEVVEVPRARVIVGGPPCQGFSQLGTRDPDDGRNSLWRDYVRILDLAQADAFVMENVPQGSVCLNGAVREVHGGTVAAHHPSSPAVPLTRPSERAPSAPPPLAPSRRRAGGTLSSRTGAVDGRHTCTPRPWWDTCAGRTALCTAT
jgi:C-5 cytosine-specific DNA methylase